MQSLLLVIHVLSAAGIIGLVLLQQGKGADMGAAFGSGASQTLFGSQGSATFLSRATAILAAVFFITSLILTAVYSHRPEAKSVTESVIQAPANLAVPAEPTKESVPAVPK